MNAGKLDTTAEVTMDVHEMACLQEVFAQDHIRTLTKSFGVAVDSATSLGYYYSLYRSPSTAVQKPPVRADRDHQRLGRSGRHHEQY